MLQLKKQKGFTLVELLVIIAIIGVLSAIIYSSFNGARAKSRDEKRVSDISSIALALEQYFNQYHYYPYTLDTLVPTFLSTQPLDPTTNKEYGYLPITTVSDSPTCTYYQLWTTFETNNSYLSAKKGLNSTGIKSDNAVASGKFFYCSSNPSPGTTPPATVDATVSPTNLVYDVIPL